MVQDKWFMEKFMQIHETLGNIDAKLDDCVVKDIDHEARLRTLEKVKTNGHLRTAGIAGGVGGAGAVLIAIITAFCKYMGWM